MTVISLPISETVTNADGSTTTLFGSLSVSHKPPPPPPPPPIPPPVFGANDKIDGGLVGLAATLGSKPVTGCKMFNTGMPSSFPLIAPGITHPLLCFKPSIPMTTADKVALTALAKSAAAAAPHAMLTAYQEGEHDGFTPAQIKAVHAECWDVVHAAAPDVLYGQCEMSFDARPAGNGALAQWVGKRTDGGALDFYGIDTYPWSTSVLPGDLLDACLAQLKTVIPNPNIAITECNATSNILTASIQPGAAWFAGCWNWAVAHAIPLFYIFAQTSRSVPWPPDAATVAELSTIAHASGL